MSGLGTKLLSGTGIACILFLAGAALASPFAPAGRSAGEGARSSEETMKRHIVLLGASVGNAWNVGELPSRVGNDDYVFEYVGEYHFDKTAKLAEILARAQKPDAIILKECAAYFPGDLAAYQRSIRDWVARCRAAGVVPILATTVPVVKSYPVRILVLELLHGRLEYPSKAFPAIIAYNDWIRSYAASEGLVVLDLEAALRTSDRDRHLRGSYARRDGLHLNERAYRALDAIMIPTVSKVRFAR